MDYNRAALKQRVRQAMRSQRPHPMLVTLLFTVIVSVGSQIINQTLGAASGASAMSAAFAAAVLCFGDLFGISSLDLQSGLVIVVFLMLTPSVIFVFERAFELGSALLARLTPGGAKTGRAAPGRGTKR